MSDERRAISDERWAMGDERRAISAPGGPGAIWGDPDRSEPHAGVKRRPSSAASPWAKPIAPEHTIRKHMPGGAFSDSVGFAIKASRAPGAARLPINMRAPSAAPALMRRPGRNPSPQNIPFATYARGGIFRFRRICNQGVSGFDKIVGVLGSG